MKVRWGKKSFEVNAREVGFFGKISGLMFRERNTENLLFSFSSIGMRSIHSFFVKFPFLAIWLDEKNNVVDWIIVRPFTTAVTPKKHFKKLLEIPMNTDNERIFRVFVGGKKDLNIS